MSPPDPSPETTRRPRKTSLLAILGLVLAIAGFIMGFTAACGGPSFPLFISLPVIVVNLIALVRIFLSRGAVGGTGMAITGLILGLFMLIFGDNHNYLRATDPKARKVCGDIDAAILAYYDDYGHLPLSHGISQAGQDIEILSNRPQGVELLTVLMGLEDESPDMLNPKKIRFLDLPEGKSNRDGIIYDSDDRILGFYDPWGQPYRVLLDADSNESLDNPFSNDGQPVLKRRVATFTFGKNGKNDHGYRDDIKTW